MLNLQNYKPIQIDMSLIITKSNQLRYREAIEGRSVKELAQSLADDGQKFPIVVWKRAPLSGGQAGDMQLICGFRRLEAAKSLGWKKIAATVIPESDLTLAEAIKLSLLENVERKSFSTLEHTMMPSGCSIKSLRRFFSPKPGMWPSLYNNVVT